MRKTLLLAALISTCAGAAMAQGQPPDQQTHERHGPDMLFEGDTNHDGVLTRQEFDTQHGSMFDRMDANHDGQLSRDEHRGMGMRRHGERMGGHMGLARADANHDGNITRDEFLAGPLEHFNRIDANHDGVIQASEMPQPRERHAEGGPPPGEPGQQGETRERHARVNPDTNNDGQISRAEFIAAGGGMFDHLDANHDGRVTRAEAEAAHPPGPPPR